MERLLLWFLEGFAEEQGGPQARRREAPPAACWDLWKKGRSLSRLGQRLLARWRAEAFLSRGPDF